MAALRQCGVQVAGWRVGHTLVQEGVLRRVHLQELAEHCFHSFESEVVEQLLQAEEARAGGGRQTERHSLLPATPRLARPGSPSKGGRGPPASSWGPSAVSACRLPGPSPLLPVRAPPTEAPLQQPQPLPLRVLPRRPPRPRGPPWPLRLGERREEGGERGAPGEPGPCGWLCDPLAAASPPTGPAAPPARAAPWPFCAPAV